MGEAVPPPPKPREVKPSTCTDLTVPEICIQFYRREEKKWVEYCFHVNLKKYDSIQEIAEEILEQLVAEYAEKARFKGDPDVYRMAIEEYVKTAVWDAMVEYLQYLKRLLEEEAYC